MKETHSACLLVARAACLLLAGLQQLPRQRHAPAGMDGYNIRGTPPPCRELPTMDPTRLAPNVSFIRSAGIEVWTRWLGGHNKTQPLGVHFTHVPKAGGTSLKRNLYCLLDCSHLGEQDAQLIKRTVVAKYSAAQQAFAFCNLTTGMVRQGLANAREYAPSIASNF